jgi:hypothetical protein
MSTRVEAVLQSPIVPFGLRRPYWQPICSTKRDVAAARDLIA